MDRSYMINEYTRENEENLDIRDDASNYLNYLKLCINGSKSITEVMIQVSKFLDKYDVDDQIKNDLLKMCNEFNEKTPLDVAQTRLEDYLAKNLEEKEKEYLKSDDSLTEVKNELIDDSKRILEDVGIELNGDNSEVIDNINDIDDVNRIKNNVQVAETNFYERNKVVDNNEVSNVEVAIDTINEIVESSKDDIILDKALENEEKELATLNPSMIESNEDGSICVNGNSHDDDSMNFAAMMTMALLTTNPGTTNYNLNMKLIKDNSDISSFKIIYGNFPLTNHPENKLDPIIQSQIMGLTNTYNANVDYMELLAKSSKELETAMSIIYDDVLDKPGAFQMAVKNDNGKYDMMFGMDKNYSNVLDALNINGADVTYDNNEQGIAEVRENMPGDQIATLVGTKETLAHEKELNPELVNNYQYIKKLENYDNSEAANTSYNLLMVIMTAELLLLSSYLIMMFTK